MPAKSPEAHLERFLARYTPEIAGLARAARARLQELLPGAVQMIYDNYNALVIGFGATERPSKAVLSVALYPRWVNLYFLHGASLPDPERLLQGGGKQVRFIRLEDAAMLDRPAVRALVARAAERSAEPFDGPGRLVIRAVAPTKRARRPAK